MRIRVWCGAMAALALLATGCGGGGSEDPGKSGGSAGDAVRATDCKGRVTTFDSTPTKIVTSNAAALELLLRLGVGDKVIGTGFPPGKGAFKGDLDAQAREVPVLSKAVIPKEKLLGSGADLFIDAFGPMNMGGAGGLPTDEEFKAAGIKHISLKSTACASTRKKPATDLDTVKADITTFGAVTGKSDRAAELVVSMDRKVASVQKAVGKVPAKDRPSYFFFDYDAGTKQPMAICNKQIGNAVITLAGARNIFADCAGTFRPVGWEDVVAKNPDWIQLAVRNRGSEAETRKAFDDARKWLENNPATKDLKAVKNGKFLRIGSEETTIAGVRNADTVEKIANALYPGKVRAAEQ
ncbi:ABC transporter substrate-binding protein [Streptomyces sp. NPDC086554]|uniref:ABC transporter substrate-binding protein n=1 Tax=Streptomyces sp. NPDC086554 TaxID=3154864 RepID=UPI00342F99DE